MEISDNKFIKSIPLLLLLTILLLILHNFSFNKTLVIDPTSGISMKVLDDSVLGGASQSKYYIENGRYVLDCTIRISNAWPYCEFDIDVSQRDGNGKIYGLDLSAFDSVSLWIGYENKNNAGIRVHIRNFNSAYATEDNPDSLKYNSIEWFKSDFDYPVTIPMDTFQVASWWIVERNIPLKQMAPEFNDVRSIEIVTGTEIAEGSHRLFLDKIAFHGKYITRAQLYFGILLIWMAAGASYIVSWGLHYRNKIKLYTQRERELESINQLLNNRSQELQEKIIRDPLTGVLNREGLKDLFFSLEESKKTKLPRCCIVMLDIDHFKKVNDVYGHNFGDTILCQFSALIAENIRSSDFLARWGGEEFILVCPLSKIDSIIMLAEKLRRIVEEYQWPKGISVTCSFGVAQLDYNESLEDFIERADKALYQAKSRGRNQVVEAQKYSLDQVLN
ncbi:GGDEF domain-containing protein [Teredinibacter sp. KSP-S5-2]|uniref:GGDEF domain-containing protein n=1 Tax=Teredinibacter sp. KSP-S5-2 TaxID=3034506 RepID=UPI002934E603|nr:GGDEF domain-containing protein [Teredinibacter sp. KSP-S5-2]WNO10953.1 GGDEF domain-containing protein [Teredinibacter sp. KSP-S5-2]